MYAAPLIGPWVGDLKAQNYEKLFQRDIELMKELAEQLPDNKGAADEVVPDHLQGAALRALRHFLDENDQQQHWGRLKKVLTPEGHYLWLCEYHAREYK